MKTLNTLSTIALPLLASAVIAGGAQAGDFQRIASKNASDSDAYCEKSSRSYDAYKCRQAQKLQAKKSIDSEKKSEQKGRLQQLNSGGSFQQHRGLANQRNIPRVDTSGWNQPPSGPQGGCNIDPEARLTLSNIRRNSDGSYNFTLNAGVSNVGSADYQSGNNQQGARLYPTGSSRTTLANLNSWSNLPAGRSVSTQFHVRNYRTSTEFFTGYTLRISYDPDIRMDGNPNNDDCRNSNNVISIDQASVHRQLGV